MDIPAHSRTAGRRIAGLLAFLLVWAAGCTPMRTDNRLKAVVDSLDYSIQHKDIYVKQKERRITNIKAALTTYGDLSDLNRYVIYNQLQEEYYKFQQDSAIYYAQRCIEMAIKMNDSYRHTQSDLQLAINQAMHGQYRQSRQILDKYTPESIPNDLLPDFYNANIQYMQYFMYTSSLPEDEVLMRAYRDEFYSTQDKSSVEYNFNEVARMPENERLGAYKRLLNEVEKGSPIYARISYSIGSIEMGNGHTETAKIFLTRSALADLYNVTRENQSIYELAQIAYDEGDYLRAYRYAQSSFADAITAGIPFRVAQISGFFSIITNIYQQREALAKQRLILIVVLCCVLMACLIAAIYFIFKQLRKIMRIRHDLADSNNDLQRLNEKLAEMNAQLHDSNSLLQENNAIKEQYIAQFFNICSGYIDKIGDFQRELHRMAINKNYEDLVKKLRSTSLIEKETENLYNYFDTIFLNLYPTFVDDINARLKESDRISLKAGTLLNKELRIYALLRLGITDSEKIAGFLHCSISTIYNYRSKMRNKMSDGKTTLEDKVSGIGKTDILR